MSAVISVATPAPAAPASEGRHAASDDSRFGAELESAKAAIDPTTSGSDAKSHADTASATGEVSTDTSATVAPGAAPATPKPPAAPASTLPASASIAEATIPAAPTTQPTDDSTAMAAAAVPITPATAGTAPAIVAVALQSSAAESATVAAESLAGAKSAGTATGTSVDEPTVAPKKVPGDDSAVDAVPVQPLSPTVVPPLVAVTPLPAAPAGNPTVAEPQPQISVAPAAVSGPMLAAAATDKPSATADATPAVSTPGFSPIAPAQATVQPAPVATTATAAEAPRLVDQPLAAQLVKPMAALRTAGDGNHIITIAVTPEHLGPVVVRAHVTGDAIRIELVAPTEQSREALKAIMPDLRRDLSQSGGQLSLDLSSGNQPSGRESFGESADRARPRDFEVPAPAASTIRTPNARTESALDVLV